MLSRRVRGYLLLPVAIAIAVIGVLAFYSANQSAVNVETTVGEYESRRLEYVAQAGLQHALREFLQQGCGPYTDLTAVAFGGDSYSTLLTTALGATTAYTLFADQDAWIRSDQPSVNQGGDSRLHVRFEGGTVERPLYRFNLSSIPVNSAILSARAWFYVTKEFPEGPVNLHALGSDWLEAGVTWNSHGAAMDSATQNSIPAQAAAGVWVSVNLTAQVQAWVNGAPNYGIALDSTSEGTHGDFASREHANAPYLEIIVGNAPATTATLTATGTLANGIERSMTRGGLELRQQPGFVQLQPDESDGKDTYLYEWKPAWNHGASNDIWVDERFSDSTAHGLIRFDFGAIPAGASIVSARLNLYQTNSSLNGGPVGVYRIKSAWDEGSQSGGNGISNWTQRNTFNNWSAAGGDFAASRYALQTVPAGNGWSSWEIGDLVDGWVSGRFSNQGLVLIPEIAGAAAHFASSDASDPALRPQLAVIYRCQCGIACIAPQGSGRIALVGDWDNLQPRPEDLMKEAVIESWGYQVDQYDDNFIWTVNDSNYDLYYVSDTATEAEVGTQLTGKTLAVINELGDLNDELQLAGGEATTSGSTIDIVDNSHFITRPFASGSLPIYSAPMELLTVSGTPAPDLQTLAEVGSTGSLVVLDQGGQMTGGGNAPGRRVTLPLGSGLDWNYLNANGRLLVQRAIEWGMNQTASGTGPGIWISTGQDVSASGAPGLDAWVDGEALNFTDPNLALEPGTTNGTLVSMINLDDFTGNADIDALHIVGSSISIGAFTNSVDLLPGDLILSTANDETLTSTNSITVANEDVFVFRPDNPGDYSAGTFIFLLDGSQMHGENDTVGISLVEKDTSIGNGNVMQGDFIMAITNRRDVIGVRVFAVGPGTTSVSTAELIDGPSLSLGSEIRGMELVEDEVILGGHSIPSGSILLTLNNDDPGGVGDNLVPADSSDIFYLTVTQIGTSPVADATLLFEGADINLDSDAEHLQAIALNTVVTPDPLPLPIAHWKLDETTGSTAVDSVGGHDGTVSGASWTGGQLDGGLDFDGIDDRIVVPDDPGLRITSNLTVVAWVNSQSAAIGDTYRIISKEQSGLNNGYWMALSGGFFWAGIGGEFFSSSATFEPDRWYHLAITYDDAMDEVKMYVDGVEQLSQSTTAVLDVNTDDLIIGDNWEGFKHWEGILDDVRLYDITLSATQIAELAVPPPKLPVAHWRLDETGGTTAVDSEGGNDGTLFNGPAWNANGQINGALDFDESDDYVRTTDFSYGSEFTLSFGFRMDTNDGGLFKYLFSHGDINSFDSLNVFMSESSHGTDPNMLRTVIRDSNDSLDNFALQFDVSGIIGDGDWHSYALTVASGFGARVYLDGVLQNSDLRGGDDFDPSGDLYFGARQDLDANRMYGGSLDDIRIYDSALSDSEIAELHPGSGQGIPGGAGYHEMYQPWFANNADTWEVVDLSVFGVPANAVVEVAVINESTSAQRWGGVRAVGSSVERRIQLHEAESGGIDMVTMHVQADANGRIEHFSDNNTDVVFTLLGYWTGASYRDAFEPFSANAQGVWVEESVADDGVGPSQVAEILIMNTNTSAERLVGVRASGTSHQRRFMLHEAESGGVDALSMMVTADASSIIEVYSANTTDIEFYVLGTWSTPPGVYTETGGVHGQVTSASSWETHDLSSYGVPADSVAQFVLANENTATENSMRVREVGSTINNRGLFLHEAESGGSDLGSLHVNVDASQQVQWAATQGSTLGYFYPVGWWVLSP